MYTCAFLVNWQADATCCVLMIGSVASHPALAQARLLFYLEVLTATMRTRDSLVTCSGSSYVENDMNDV